MCAAINQSDLVPYSMIASLTLPLHVKKSAIAREKWPWHQAAIAKGSTCLWMGCARPIHGSGRIERTQSAKLGMKPRSSRTCCSPTSRTGTTRPVDSVIVTPKKRSSMKMPSARSEEHTSELQSLMRISYAVFCLKKQKHRKKHHKSIN